MNYWIWIFSSKSYADSAKILVEDLINIEKKSRICRFAKV